MQMIDFSELCLEFKDAGDFIRLEPLHFIYPNAQSDTDRNCINTLVIIKGGVFSGQYTAEFMTTDFELFKQELKALYTDFRGSAKFDPLEKQLVLSIQGDGLGHFQLDCEANPDPHIGHCLSYSISFDQTQIKEYIRQLEAITRKFPIDGNFNLKG